MKCHFNKPLIKGGECLFFDTQDHFNLLCKNIDVPDDSIVIDQLYCCYLDFQGVPDVQPATTLCEDLDNLDEALFHKGLKKIKSKTWLKRL